VSPKTKSIINTARNIVNKILAIAAAPVAIPVKPNKAATIATIKNINDHLSILTGF
jgi:hypothetical protein